MYYDTTGLFLPNLHTGQVLPRDPRDFEAHFSKCRPYKCIDFNEEFWLAMAATDNSGNPDEMTNSKPKRINKTAPNEVIILLIFSVRFHLLRQFFVVGAISIFASRYIFHRFRCCDVKESATLCASGCHQFYFSERRLSRSSCFGKSPLSRKGGQTKGCDFPTFLFIVLYHQATMKENVFMVDHRLD